MSEILSHRRSKRDNAVDGNGRANESEAGKRIAIIPESFFESGRIRSLTGRSLKVFLVLALHRGNENGKAYPSVDTISRLSGVDCRDVRRHLRTLEDLKFINVTLSTGRKTNHYRIDWGTLVETPQVATLGKSTQVQNANPGGNAPPTLVETRRNPGQIHPPEHSRTENEQSIPAARGALWDSICQVFDFDPNPKARTHKTRLGKLVREFGELNATPDEISKRADRLRRTWGDKCHTPESLHKHWGKFAADVADTPRGDRTARVAAAAGKYDGIAVVVDANV